MSDEMMRNAGLYLEKERDIVGVAKASRATKEGYSITERKSNLLSRRGSISANETDVLSLDYTNYSVLQIFVSLSNLRNFEINIYYRMGTHSSYLHDAHYFERKVSLEELEKYTYKNEEGNSVDAYQLKPFTVPVPACNDVVIEVKNTSRSSLVYALSVAGLTSSGTGASDVGASNTVKIDGVDRAIRYELDEQGRAVPAFARVDSHAYDPQLDVQKTMTLGYDEESDSLKVNDINREEIIIFNEDTITSNHSETYAPPKWAKGAAVILNVTSVTGNKVTIRVNQTGVTAFSGGTGLFLEKEITSKYNTQFLFYPGATKVDAGYRNDDGLICGSPLTGGLRAAVVLDGDSADISMAIIWLR